MKEEADGSDQDPRFSRILHDNLLPQIQQGRWFLENRIPSLGEVRGKAILLSRFDVKEGDGWVGEDGIGIHPSTWPDSARNGFEWDCAGTTFRTQDWYRLSTFMDIPEKHASVSLCEHNRQADHEGRLPCVVKHATAGQELHAVVHLCSGISIRSADTHRERIRLARDRSRCLGS